MRLLLSSSRNWNRSRRIMTGRSKGLLAKKKDEKVGIQKYLCEDSSSEEEDEFDNVEDDAFTTLDKTIMNTDNQ